VDAAGLSDAYLVRKANRMVEAAGIEPVILTNSNPMMANDFGFYCVKTFELPRRFESPGVPSSPLESSPVLEIFWRRHDVPRDGTRGPCAEA
jgi:hypothetical protein